MTRFIVVARASLPVRVPVVPSLVFALALRVWDLPTWVAWVGWTYLGIWTLLCLLQRLREHEVDPFSQGDIV